MTVSELLSELRAHQVRLTVDGDKLRVSAPSGAVSPALMEELRRNKQGILDALRAGERQAKPAERAAMKPVDRSRPFPLSKSQQRLWFMDSVSPGTPLLNVPSAFRLRGPLDIAALRRAVREIVRRHEALRTTIETTEEGPLQSVGAGDDFELESLDCSLDPELRSPDLLPQTLSRLVSRPFACDGSPLFRAGLVSLGEEDHVLWWVASHLVWDGGSLEPFLNELRTLYTAFSDGRPSPLDELPIQYGDFVAWHEQWVKEAPRRKHLDYWKKKLGGHLPALSLPVDHPRPPQVSHHGAAVFFTIPSALRERLHAVASDNGATLYMVLLAALKLTLYKYSGEKDVIVGAPIAGRVRPEIEDLIGLFVNTLAMRTQIDEKGSFLELLERVKEACLDAHDHQHTQFEELVEALRPARDRSRTPLFQVFLSFQQSSGRTSKMGAVALERLDVHAGGANTDLTFWLTDEGGEVAGTVEYAKSLFERRTIERLIGCFRELLEEIAEDPAKKVDAFDGLRAQRAELDAWNARERLPVEPEGLVHRMFEAQVERTPDRIALRFEREALTYRELADRVHRFARRLRAAGVVQDSRVGLCMHRSVDLVVALLGIHAAGGGYVPLDPSYPVDRIRYMLEDSGVRVVVAEGATYGLLQGQGQGATVVVVDADRDGTDRESPEPLDHPESPTQLAYMMYTSGSTGRPKGALLEHRNVVAFLRAARLRAGLRNDAAEPREGVWLAATSICFDLSLLEIFGSLAHGFTVVLLGDQRFGDSADAEFGIATLIERHGVTHFQCTPSQATLLVEQTATRAAFGRLERIILGGEVLPQGLARDLKSLGIGKVVNVYGPTECTIWSCSYEVNDTDRPVPIGRAIAGTRFYVLDAAMQRRPVGALGELYVAGAGVGRGYHDRAELTAERFLPDPHVPGERMYRSGDLVRIAEDGVVEFFGRNDFQVKIRGYRIELGEIETVLAAHPGVKEAVVVARANGAAGTTLVGYYAPTAGVAPNVDELKGHLARNLPPYMVPPVFVAVPALPLTPTGKIDRKALPEPRKERNAAPREPRNDTERKLLAIWRENLNAPDLGMDDDFFDRGGHSLLGVRLLSAVHRAFGVPLSLAALFEVPTVAAMAERLREELAQPDMKDVPSSDGTRPWSTLVPMQPKGSLPPFFCVAGRGGNPMNLRHVAAALGEEQPFYGVQHRGVDGRLPPHTSIEEMASECVQHIRALQPNGPYYVGGFSGGGTVALEIAQQLRAAGEPVGAVVFMDAVNPRLPAWTVQERLRFHAKKLREDGPRYLLYALKAGAIRRFEELRIDVLGRAAEFDEFQFRNERVALAWDRMAERYVPKPYADPVFLMRSKIRDAMVFAEDNGWGDVVKDNLRVVDVEGGHVSFVDETNARPTAARLTEILAGARARCAEASLAASAREAAPPASTGMESPKARGAFQRTPVAPESTSNVS